MRSKDLHTFQMRSDTAWYDLRATCPLRDIYSETSLQERFYDLGVCKDDRYIIPARLWTPDHVHIAGWGRFDRCFLTSAWYVRNTFFLLMCVDGLCSERCISCIASVAYQCQSCFVHHFVLLVNENKNILKTWKHEVWAQPICYQLFVWIILFCRIRESFPCERVRLDTYKKCKLGDKITFSWNQ